MSSLSGADLAPVLIKCFWLLAVAGATFFAVRAIYLKASLDNALSALKCASDQRDEAVEALEQSRRAVMELEARLATQGDSIRLSMAVIDERLAEARRTKAREARIKRLLAADPSAGESRVETLNRRIDEALKEPRTWSDPT
jgi:uncharacterized coiled-coil protein SlyX